jgi:hypothetical protein
MGHNSVSDVVTDGLFIRVNAPVTPSLPTSFEAFKLSARHSKESEESHRSEGKTKLLGMFLAVTCQHASGTCQSHSRPVLNLREALRKYVELSPSTPPFLTLWFYEKDLMPTPNLLRISGGYSLRSGIYFHFLGLVASADTMQVASADTMHLSRADTKSLHTFVCAHNSFKRSPPTSTTVSQHKPYSSVWIPVWIHTFFHLPHKWLNKCVNSLTFPLLYIWPQFTIGSLEIKFFSSLPLRLLTGGSKK